MSAPRNLTGRGTHHAVALLSLALPFVLMIIFTDGLMNPLPTFHGTDEKIYHFPTIQKFAAELPAVQLEDYRSATTPLFHLVFATLGKLTGYELPTLRLLNVFFSYAAIAMFYLLLINRFNIPRQTAFLLAVIFELSPYFFGVSFMLFTDNLAILLFITTVYYWLKFEEDNKSSSCFTAFIFLALTLLTRQTYIYVYCSIVVYILLRSWPFSQKMTMWALSLVSIIPLFALFYLWKGPTPPSFQTQHLESSVFNLKSVMFGFAVTGLYAPFILHNNFQAEIKRAWVYTLAILTVGVVAVAVFPMIVTKTDQGFLWRIAQYLPKVLGSSLLFYFLVPSGVLTIAILLRKFGLNFLVLTLILFLLFNAPHRLVFQKYFDISILLLLSFIAAGWEKANRWYYAKLVGLLLLFLTYLFAYQILEPSL
jgi:hypothetical protein